MAGSHSNDPHIFSSSLLKEMANNWDVRSSRTRNFFLDSSPDRRRLSPQKNTGSGFSHHGGGYVWFENPAIETDRKGTKKIQLRGKSCKMSSVSVGDAELKLALNLIFLPTMAPQGRLPKLL